MPMSPGWLTLSRIAIDAERRSRREVLPAWGSTGPRPTPRDCSPQVTTRTILQTGCSPVTSTKFNSDAAYTNDDDAGGNVVGVVIG